MKLEPAVVSETKGSGRGQEDSFFDLRGLGKVFGFTLRQLLRARANLVSLILLIFMAVAMVPILSLSGGSSAHQDERIPGGMVASRTECLSLEEYLQYGLPDAEDAPGEDDSELGVDYYLQLGCSVLVMMLSMLSVSYIVRSVVEEKASKLVELLMISIRPAALILGKILAVLVMILLQLALVLLSFGLSCLVFGSFMDISPITGGFSRMGDLMTRFGPSSLLMALVTVMLSVFSFALLSGLTGAGCSNMEESGNAIGIPMVIIMGCYMISIFTSLAGSESAAGRIMSLIPFLSAFVAPIQYMNGGISLLLLILSWLIQLAVIVLLIYICARVYRELLIRSGKRVSFSTILQMAFRPGTSGKEVR